MLWSWKGREVVQNNINNMNESMALGELQSPCSLEIEGLFLSLSLKRRRASSSQKAPPVLRLAYRTYRRSVVIVVSIRAFLVLCVSEFLVTMRILCRLLSESDRPHINPNRLSARLGSNQNCPYLSFERFWTDASLDPSSDLDQPVIMDKSHLVYHARSKFRQ
jgi:hypothetical protein